MQKLLLSCAVAVLCSVYTFPAVADSSQPTCAENTTIQRKFLETIFENEKLQGDLAKSDRKVLRLDSLVKLYEENEKLFNASAQSRVEVIMVQQKIIQEMQNNVVPKWYQHPALWTAIGIAVTLGTIGGGLGISQMLNTK